MLTSEHAVKIDDMLDAGWSLIGPDSMNSGWKLQQGKPGAGGDTVRVHASVAKRKIRDLVCISGYRNEYCRRQFAREYRG